MNLKKNKALFTAFATCLLVACGGGGSAGVSGSDSTSSGSNLVEATNPVVPVVSTPEPVQRVTSWRQTTNIIEIDIASFYIKEGFNTHDFFGKGYKSFFISPDGIMQQPRSQSDPDFMLFSIGPNNTIRQDPSPLENKYIAGHVNDTLIGNFGKGPNSIVFIDHGRELPGGVNNSNFEFSYLWRMDKVNNIWTVSEFAKEFGRQFWHSSSNPLDVNGDGILDFAVSSLSNAVEVLFLSNTNGEHDGVSMASNLPDRNSGASALINISGGKFAIISLPYNQHPEFNILGQTGSIMTLSTDGRTVIKNQAINVRDYGITDTEGYAKIKVLDLNKDGLDDFLALAECSTGCLSKQNRIIAYTQNIDGTFASANVDLNIPFTYTLPNQDNTDQWSDSLGSHIDVFASKAGSPLSIHFESIQVSQLQISNNGIRGSISLNGSAISILPENITWNNEKKPWVFNYIIPTDLNNDGIVDYILVGSTFDGVKTTSNPYGQVGYISAVVSEVK